MTDPYTHKSLAEVEDAAEKFGHGGSQEAHFANRDLETEQSGLSFHRVKPGKRSARGSDTGTGRSRRSTSSSRAPAG
jgi:hypothetical protein